MQGNIDFTGSLSGSIAGGGGGGSDVTITPTLATGTKIADYTIDSESGSLYAPTPEGLTAELPLDISNNIISIDLSDYATVSDLDNYQEKLTAGNYINIDSNNEISCTPPITNVWYTPEPDVQQDVLIGKFTVNEVTQNVYAPSGGSSWDYSTSEVNTGQKWINGHDIYCKVIMLNNRINVTNNYSTIVGNVPNIEYLIDATCYDNNGGSDYQQIRTINNANIEVLTVNNGDIMVNYSGSSQYTQFIGLCIKYTKSV